MKPTNEVVVEKDALLAAVTADGLADAPMDPDDVEIGPSDRGIETVTASIEAELGAKGVWRAWITTSRCLLEELLTRATRPAVKLTFVGNSLYVGRLWIPAECLVAR